VLVFNNFNFGMTGGEHSVTTPPGAVTATTRGGNLERPLDLCATVAVNGAGYVWRGTAFDKSLPDVIAEAVQSDGFALLDIWELCTAYYVPNNKFSRKALETMREELGMPMGLVHRAERPEYARALREAGKADAGQPVLPPRALAATFPSNLTDEFRLVVAGSAGGKIKSAVRMVGEAALLSGLWAAQQDDYPVTVQTGHSISELIVSPREILFTGVTRPDALVLISEEGRKKAARQLAALTKDGWLFTTPQFAGIETSARTVVFDAESRGARGGRRNLGLLLTAAALRRLDLFPIAACEEAARLGTHGALRDEVLETLAASATLAAVG
jgi:Pyruvate/2-oxoacid:ferredoxin oxidoreductase gamma subunit